MYRFLVAIALLTLCVIANAQDWVEHGGAEYNCTVLRNMLADYGDSDVQRSGDRVMTLGELFAPFFPNCPEAHASDMSEMPAENDAGSAESLFSFNSHEAGSQPVLGPMELREGVYVFTASADASMSVSPTIVSGDCGTDLELGSIIFFTSNGRTQTEQSAVEVEQTCNILLEVSKYGSDAWTLAIHKVESSALEPQSTYTFESSELGLQPVLGPLHFTDGVYTVTATSDAGMSVTPVILSGNCGTDLELGSIIFFTSDGHTQVEQSAVQVQADCEVLLEISNIGGSTWSVVIDKLS